MKFILIPLLLISLTTSVAAQVKVGGMAPEISLPNTRDSIIQLSSFRGKVVLLDFWASWCNPCRASNPGVVKLFDKYRHKGFEVFGVSIDSKKAAWIKAIAQDKIKYTQVNDKDGWNAVTTAIYGVNEIPTTFLLDKTGKIVAIDLEGKALEDEIRQLIQ